MNTRTGTILSAMTGLGAQSAPRLSKVGVDVVDANPVKFVFEGDGPDQTNGATGMTDPFGIPGFAQIGNAAMHGLPLRTITRVPDKLDFRFSAQTGVASLSFGMKVPLADMSMKGVMGCWNVNGVFLTTLDDDQYLLAKLAAAFKKHDVAFYLTGDNGEIGNKLLTLGIVSAMSDSEKARFKDLDVRTVAGLQAGIFGKSTFEGSGVLEGSAIRHLEQQPEQIANDDKLRA